MGTNQYIRRKMAEILFDKAGFSLWPNDFQTLREEGFGYLDFVNALLAFGWSIQRINNTFSIGDFAENDEEIFIERNMRFQNEYPYIEFDKSSEDFIVIGVDKKYGPMYILKNSKCLDLLGNFERDYREYGKLLELEDLAINFANPEMLSVLDTLPKLKKISVTLIDDGKKNCWMGLMNPNIVCCRVNGWSGNYKGLTIPPNVEILRLERRTARLVNTGLKNLHKLRRLETYAHPKTSAQILLEHPALEAVLLNGVKEEHILVPNNSRLSQLEITDSTIECIEIKENNLETLKISTSKILTVSFGTTANSIKSISIGTNRLSNIDFLRQLPNLEELVLSGIDVLDLAFLKEMPKMKKIKLYGVKTIANFEVLGSLKQLRELDIWKLKKIDGLGREVLLDLKYLSVQSVPSEVLSCILRSAKAEKMDISYMKKADVKDIRVLSGLKKLSIRKVGIHNLAFLKKAINLDELELDMDNDADLTFLTGIRNLSRLSIPAIPSQKEFLINEVVVRENCVINFNRFVGNSIYVEAEENYCDIEINRYDEEGNIKYGIFLDLTEALGKENNIEVERYIKKRISKIKENRKFIFDSEAENFCVYSPQLKNIKWLIDQVIHTNKDKI